MASPRNREVLRRGATGRAPIGIAGAFQIDAVTQFLYTRHVLITLVIKVRVERTA